MTDRFCPTRGTRRAQYQNPSGSAWRSETPPAGGTPTAKEEDPFEVLGLDKDASLQDVRRQYRKLALKYHPDKNGGNPATAVQFMKVQHAASELTKRLLPSSSSDEPFDPEEELRRAEAEEEREKEMARRRAEDAEMFRKALKASKTKGNRKRSCRLDLQHDEFLNSMHPIAVAVRAKTHISMMDQLTEDRLTEDLGRGSTVFHFAAWHNDRHAWDLLMQRAGRYWWICLLRENNDGMRPVDVALAQHPGTELLQHIEDLTKRAEAAKKQMEEDEKRDFPWTQLACALFVLLSAYILLKYGISARSILICSGALVARTAFACPESGCALIVMILSAGHAVEFMSISLTVWMSSSLCIMVIGITFVVMGVLDMKLDPDTVAKLFVIYASMQQFFLTADTWISPTSWSESAERPGTPQHALTAGSRRSGVLGLRYFDSKSMRFILGVVFKVGLWAAAVFAIAVYELAVVPPELSAGTDIFHDTPGMSVGLPERHMNRNTSSSETQLTMRWSIMDPEDCPKCDPRERDKRSTSIEIRGKRQCYNGSVHAVAAHCVEAGLSRPKVPVRICQDILPCDPCLGVECGHNGTCVSGKDGEWSCSCHAGRIISLGKCPAPVYKWSFSEGEKLCPTACDSPPSVSWIMPLCVDDFTGDLSPEESLCASEKPVDRAIRCFATSACARCPSGNCSGESYEFRAGDCPSDCGVEPSDHFQTCVRTWDALVVKPTFCGIGVADDMENTVPLFSCPATEACDPCARISCWGGACSEGHCICDSSHVGPWCMLPARATCIGELVLIITLVVLLSKAHWKLYHFTRSKKRSSDEVDLADASVQTRGPLGAPCVVCLERTPTYAAIPCGHRVLCHLCVKKNIKSCPMCREAPVRMYRIFDGCNSDG